MTEHKQILLTRLDGTKVDANIGESDVGCYVGLDEILEVKGRNDGAQADLVFWSCIHDMGGYSVTPVMESPDQIRETFAAAGRSIQIRPQPVTNTLRQVARILGL